MMKTSSRLLLAVIFVALGAVIGAGGSLAAPRPLLRALGFGAEAPRLVGRLAMAQFRPLHAGGCESAQVRQAALAAYWSTASAARSLAQWIRPVPAVASPAGPCLVIGVRGPYRNLIVNAGENFLVDAWQNLVEPENMKFHGIGTGTVAPAETDTALGAELTTQYNPDNTRATGSLTEGAGTNVFRTVGTNAVDAAVAITEWGLFSQAATGGGTIWSRVTFSAINLASGDSLQTTYDLTVE